MRKARGRLSMTSLIDVIFLLLLFFMLSSTFSRFGEVPLNNQSSGGGGSSDQSVVFARLTAHGMAINGRKINLKDIAPALSAYRGAGALQILVSLDDTVRAQALVDALMALRQVPDTDIIVLE